MSPVAVVTGAGRGQGAAEAALLRTRGWEVVTSDVDGEVDVIADVGDATAWATLVDGVLGRFGRLDGLVNNAAVHHTRALLDERADEVERVWRVNTLGPLLGIQAVAPAMREQGSGSIVNVSSYAGCPRPARPHGLRSSEMGAPRHQPHRSRGAGSTRHPRQHRAARTDRHRHASGSRGGPADSLPPSTARPRRDGVRGGRGRLLLALRRRFVRLRGGGRSGRGDGSLTVAAGASRSGGGRGRFTKIFSRPGRGAMWGRQCVGVCEDVSEDARRGAPRSVMSSCCPAAPWAASAIWGRMRGASQSSPAKVQWIPSV